MNSRQTARNFAIALLVQGFAFVVSATTSFIVPKIMRVEDFGYWQLFLFYVSYVGFLQFGLGDGVYLRFGGQARDEIDSGSISQQFAVGLASQVGVAGTILVLALAVEDPLRRSVLTSIGIITPIMNSKRYWGFVFQAINETKKFSYSVLVEVAVFFLLMSGMLLLGVISFEPYVFVYIIGQVAALTYCLFASKGLLVFTRVRWKRAFVDALSSLRPGGHLLLATLAGSLTLGVSRIAVDRLWDIRTFGLVSLSVTVVTFFLSLMAQAAMVLYPALRQASASGQSGVLRNLRAIALTVFPSIYVLYFPIGWLLQKWLPNYADAFVLAAFLVPIAVFDGLMQVVYSTHLKVARRERALMILNLATVGGTCAMVLVFGFCLGRIELVLLAPTFAMGVRALAADQLFVKALGIQQNGEVVALWGLGGIFILSSVWLDRWTSVVVVGLIYVLFLFWRRGDWVPSLALTIKSLRR